MSKAAFPVNDLLRRRLQTGLTIVTLTLSVASTLFLLLFSDRIGFGISSLAGTLTMGLSAIFSQFIIFIGVLIFVVGAILTSFIVFLMMAQRTRDFGLIKAAGCPNALVAGYFMTELLIITVTGCVLGIVFGFASDYAVANFAFPIYHKTPNFLFAPLVFIAFFALALIFGTRPILNAAKMSPIKALSPVNFYGLSAEKKHKPLSRSGVTWRIATRSLVRRQSATVRIVILLSVVFILLTVSIAGGIIASDTTRSWVEGPVGKNTIAVAHSTMCEQYKLLLSKFSGAKENSAFNYSDPKLAVPETAIQQLKAINAVATVDARLVLMEHVQEVANFTISPETATTYSMGDSRQGDSIVIGVDPSAVAGSWSLKGQFLSQNSDLEAVVGDSIGYSMYVPDAIKDIVFSNPLFESIKFENITFKIVGVCVDPLNNGLVTYVPIDRLENVSGVSNPNLVLITLGNSADRASTISEIKSKIQAVDPGLDVFPLDSVVEDNLGFLGSSWSVIMLLPLLTLTSAALCLVGYSMLAADEQHQEFAILRAIGTRPKIVIVILAIQSVIVLLSSFALGISLGTITTLLILMSQPLVTSVTIIMIAVYLLAALAAMFLLSLYPAIKLAKTSILKIIT